ncbi:MAG: bacteriohemerythrin [Gammaproteobacteria bacterium]|nr:bacteriohemerythrin [Gammaproteobacteria bacterium]
MALFNWKDEYSVNVLAMDNHHKKLFDILNKLHEAAKAGTGEEVVTKEISELIDYTRYHFGEEEKMLERVNYSALDSQKRSHVNFVNKMVEYQEEAASGMAIFVVPKVTKTGIDWLKEHILVMDQKYTATVNAAGIN